jgi:hypothetical protein
MLGVNETKREKVSFLKIFAKVSIWASASIFTKTSRACIFCSLKDAIEERCVNSNTRKCNYYFG